MYIWCEFGLSWLHDMEAKKCGYDDIFCKRRLIEMLELVTKVFIEPLLHCSNPSLCGASYFIRLQRRKPGKYAKLNVQKEADMG